MIHFAQAQYLLLILLIPLFFVFYALFRRGRNKKIAKFGNPELMARLMPERSRYKGWVRVSFFAVAWFFFAIGLARPQIGASLKESNRKGAEIMIALDVSNSMLAQDYYPNRLERAKLAISRLVDKLQGDRIGLIVFAGQSFVQLPITTDYVSAKIFLNTIGTESVPVQGTALGEAINTAIKSFSSEAQMQQDNKAIILITDGENHEDDAVAAARMAAEVGIRVFCIGVGSPEGKPIPYGPDGDLMKDKDGNIVVTKLNEKVLEEIAIAGGGAYVRAGNAEFGLNPIIDELEQLQQQQFKSVVFEDFEEQYMYFFAIALVFLLLEFFIGNRRVSKKMFAVAVLFMLTAGSTFAQTDRKEVRKGNRFFKDENYKEAEVEYRKALIKDSLSVAGNYNLANTLMLQDDAANAELIYAKVGDTIVVEGGGFYFCYKNSSNVINAIPLSSTSYLEYYYTLKNTTTNKTTTSSTKKITTTTSALEGGFLESFTHTVTEEGNFEVVLNLKHINPTTTYSTYHIVWGYYLDKNVSQYTQLGTNGLVSVQD
jgi:Ca-activated chloride channel family protein